jgi:hypothetical protein
MILLVLQLCGSAVLQFDGSFTGIILSQKINKILRGVSNAHKFTTVLFLHIKINELIPVIQLRNCKTAELQNCRTKIFSPFQNISF